MSLRGWSRGARIRALAVGVLVAAVVGAVVGALCCRADARNRGGALGGAPSAAAAPWQLVYERAVDGEMELFVVPAGGGVEQRLTHETAYDGLPRWTPDGKRIVFTSGRSGTPQLWEIDADGSRPRRLRSNRATEYQADVSPDGGWLAFLSNLDGPERLMIQDLRSGAVRELVRHGDHPILGNPHWSPDGRQIAFSSNWRIGHHIYVVDVATGKQRRISPLTSGGCEPRFSRDGTSVVYVSRGFMAATSRLVAHDLATDEGAPADGDRVRAQGGRAVCAASRNGTVPIRAQRVPPQRRTRLRGGWRRDHAGDRGRIRQEGDARPLQGELSTRARHAGFG